MALEDDVLRVRTLVGDVEGNLFYPLLPDSAYENFLETSNDDILQAAKLAAISISFMISSWNTREQIGDIAITNDFAKNYLSVLNSFIKNPSLGMIPNGVFPWSATSDSRSKLIDFDFCGCGDGSNKRNC